MPPVGERCDACKGCDDDKSLPIGANMKILPTEFDGQSIRRVYDENTEIW